ncbi:hypothetical protein ACFV9C_42485 [Kribbella sp. NPDC059898]|uniref:hypothetical protein n=1 Tax=Kribbella sp. NPDC059898 TaxID=3346995 RepID=UPI003664FAF4
MSDQATFTISATRSQLVRAMVDLISDTDLSDDGPGAGHAVDVFLHYLDPAQFPVHPDDAPAAIATGPTSFQPTHPGSPQYHRPDAPGFILIHDQDADTVVVRGPSDRANRFGPVPPDRPPGRDHRRRRRRRYRRRQRGRRPHDGPVTTMATCLYCDATLEHESGGRLG